MAAPPERTFPSDPEIGEGAPGPDTTAARSGTRPAARRALPPALLRRYEGLEDEVQEAAKEGP